MVKQVMLFKHIVTPEESQNRMRSLRHLTFHAQATMVTEQYDYILSENCRMNAERFQREFYTPAEDKGQESLPC